jgi:hypothetical protein
MTQSLWRQSQVVGSQLVATALLRRARQSHDCSARRPLGLPPAAAGAPAAGGAGPQLWQANVAALGGLLVIAVAAAPSLAFEYRLGGGWWLGTTSVQ